LSRRIRDDLVRLGLVGGGPVVRIAGGAAASRGDLIACTRNDHHVEAGEPGRTLANGDLLRIDAVTSGGLLVRRALDADPVTGQRRWTDQQFLYAHYEEAELGYAVTDHAAQGRTVHTGWPCSPAPKTASTSPSPAAPTRTPPTSSPSPLSAPTSSPAPARPPSWPATTALPPRQAAMPQRPRKPSRRAR
jgi:hypothetical protein